MLNSNITKKMNWKLNNIDIFTIFMNIGLILTGLLLLR